MKGSLLIFLFVLTKIGNAQSRPFSPIQIDSIVVSIDSARGLKNVSVEGVFRPDGKRGPKGSFTDTYVFSPGTKTLLKVDRGQLLNFLDFTSWYFYNDSLVMVRTNRNNATENTEKIISSGRYYFWNGTLIYSQESGTVTGKPDAFLQMGRNYLNDAKKITGL